MPLLRLNMAIQLADNISFDAEGKIYDDPSEALLSSLDAVAAESIAAMPPPSEKLDDDDVALLEHAAKIFTNEFNRWKYYQDFGLMQEISLGAGVAARKLLGLDQRHDKKSADGAVPDTGGAQLGMDTSQDDGGKTAGMLQERSINLLDRERKAPAAKRPKVATAPRRAGAGGAALAPRAPPLTFSAHGSADNPIVLSP